jgi:Flp pilus assembly protein TadG
MAEHMTVQANTIQKRASRESGNAIIELAIILPCLVTFFLGAVGMGIMLGRHVQVEQACRDIAHMYSNGVDFTQAVNQNIIMQYLADGTGMSVGTGTGVFIFSRIETVYQADCDAAAISACTFLNDCVFTQQYTLGDSTMRPSVYGTPTASLKNSSGNISPTNYLGGGDGSVQAIGFEAALQTAANVATGPVQLEGEVACVVECYFKYPDINFFGWPTQGGAYAKYIFHN